MIVVDATPMQSEHRDRGVGTYTRELTRRLAVVEPQDVRFVATKTEVDRLPPAVGQRSILVHRGHRPAQVYWMYNEWSLRRAVRRARPVVFHATDFNGLVLIKGVPTVATLYDLTPLREGLGYGSLSVQLDSLRWWVYFRRKLRQARHIIAISESARADAIRMLEIPADRITTIPLGVDTDQFTPIGEDSPEAPAGPYFLFVGTRAPNKNLERVLRAFARVAQTDQSVTLLISGRWREPDRAWLQTFAGSLGIGGRVRHLGFVPEDMIAGVYRDARALLFPSLEEGFGLPAIEAMACGTPVITSNRGVLREVAGDAALLVDPTDEQSISDATGRLLADDSLWRKLRELGLARAIDYSWDTVVTRTLDVYRDVQAREEFGRSR